MKLRIDADWTKFGFHLHILRRNQITPVFALWCLWGMDAGIAFGRRDILVLNLSHKSAT